MPRYRMVIRNTQYPPIVGTVPYWGDPIYSPSHARVRRHKRTLDRRLADRHGGVCSVTGITTRFCIRIAA